MKPEGKKLVLEALKGIDIFTVPGEFKAVDVLTQLKIAESRSEARKILWEIRKDPLEIDNRDLSR